jgi:hypothetical protein
MRSKLKWYYVLLGFAVVGVVVTAIIRILTPPPISVPTTTFTSKSVGDASIQYRNLSYTGSKPNFPNSLPIGLVQPSTDTPSTLLDSLISSFQLTQHPNLTFIWLGQGKSLTYDSASNVATLSLAENTTPPTTSSSTPFPSDEAITKTNTFISSNLPFLKNATLQEERTAYFTGDLDLHPATQQDASFATFHYAQTINSYPIFINSAQSYPIEVLVSRDLVITKVVASLQSFTYSLTPNQNLISIDDAIKNLNTNQTGILLSFATQDGIIESFEDITGGTLDSVSLEYRLDPQANMLYPFYHFSGTVTTPTGTSTVHIATPAIKTTDQSTR